jgi:hypothetical protein
LIVASKSFATWQTDRAESLDEIVGAHHAVGGTGPGRRYATQQINRAYAVLLSSQLQGFCRDLHSEAIDALVVAITNPDLVRIVREEFSLSRKLDKGNPNPGNIGSDFNRLGFDFWDAVKQCDPQNAVRQTSLELLNEWRNAIAHQDFDPNRLGGSTMLHLSQVETFRRNCHSLAAAFDEVVRNHVQSITGQFPW